MYDHSDQGSDPALAGMSAHHTARTAAAIAACLNSLAEEADQAGLGAVASFIEAAAHLAEEEARAYRMDLKPFSHPNLVWSAPAPESA